MVESKKARDIPATKPAPKITLDRLAAAYIKMRDKKTEMKHAFDEEERKLKEKMGKLEIAMLEILNTVDGNSVRTDHGTVIRQEEILPTGSDWAAFYDWVKDNDAFDALERRIKKTFVKEYMESHEGATPPGVTVLREFVVRVRRN